MTLLSKAGLIAVSMALAFAGPSGEQIERARKYNAAKRSAPTMTRKAWRKRKRALAATKASRRINRA